MNPKGCIVCVIEPISKGCLCSLLNKGNNKITEQSSKGKVKTHIYFTIFLMHRNVKVECVGPCPCTTCDCPSLKFPVCGSNRRSYDNFCKAGCA